MTSLALVMRVALFAMLLVLGVGLYVDGYRIAGGAVLGAFAGMVSTVCWGER